MRPRGWSVQSQAVSLRAGESVQAEVIVVDYACPEQSGHWVRQSHPSVKVVFAEDGGAFNACRARNLGAGQSKAEILIFADADTLIDPGAAAEIDAKLQPGTYGVVEVEADDQLQDDLRGTCMVYRADFDRAGGYDEYLKGYAMEDIDLYDRLNCLDLKPVTISLKWFGAIKHADDLRMKYRGGRKEISQLVSLLYRRYIGAVRRMQRKPQADAEVRELIYRQSEQLVMRLIEAKDPSGGVQIGLLDRRISAAEINGLGLDLLDATRRADALVVDLVAGCLLIGFSPFGVNSVGEGCTCARDVGGQREGVRATALGNLRRGIEVDVDEG